MASTVREESRRGRLDERGRGLDAPGVGIPNAAECDDRADLLGRADGRAAPHQHVSTRDGVAIGRRRRGIAVTAEATPHHFTLTEEAVDGYRTDAKMNPPLRTAEDVAAVRAGIADGTLDVIATDHAPHHYDEKEQAFDEAPFGIVGLETALGLAVTELVEKGVITLPQLVERMSTAPARAFRLPGGTLRPGSPADVTVFDPSVNGPSAALPEPEHAVRRWRLQGARLHHCRQRVVWNGTGRP